MKQPSHLNTWGWTRRWLDYFQHHYPFFVLAIITLTVMVLYLPSITAYFVSDDYATVAFLFFNKSLLNGEGLKWFLLQSNDGGIYFRAFGQLMYQVDSMMWGVLPFGYHLTNLIFHVLNSFLVYLLARRLTHSQPTATIAALLFAVLPVHVEAVAWIAARYDVICGFFYLSAFLFYILSREGRSRGLFLLAIMMFVLALASKEIAFTFPIVILVYEILLEGFHIKSFQNIFKRQWIFWFVFAAFLAARWIVFGRIGYRGAEISFGDLAYWADRILSKMLDPFISDIGLEALALLLGAIVLLLVFFRSRPVVWFSLAWIPLTYVAIINTGISDRSFYVPSFGLTLFLTFCIDSMKRTRIGRAMGLVILVGLFAIYGSTTVTRNQLYFRAGEVAQSITDQVKGLYPTLPQNQRMVFVGVPDQLSSGVLVYITGLQPAIELVYRRQDLQVIKVDDFPVDVDNRDETLFFLVDHRNVIDKTATIRNTVQSK